MEKDACLAALAAEYERLGRPLAQLQYNGAQARAHVLQLMEGGDAPDITVPEPKSAAPPTGSDAIVSADREATKGQDAF